jgi:hypothetical protein
MEDLATKEDRTVPELETALEEALELAQEGWAYASPYFQEKWGFERRYAKLQAKL